MARELEEYPTPGSDRRVFGQVSFMITGLALFLLTALWSHAGRGSLAPFDFIGLGLMGIACGWSLATAPRIHPHWKYFLSRLGLALILAGVALIVSLASSRVIWIGGATTGAGYLLYVIPLSHRARRGRRQLALNLALLLALIGLFVLYLPLLLYKRSAEVALLLDQTDIPQIRRSLEWESQQTGTYPAAEAIDDVGELLKLVATAGGSLAHTDLYSVEGYEPRDDDGDGRADSYTLSLLKRIDGRRIVLAPGSITFE